MKKKREYQKIIKKLKILNKRKSFNLKKVGNLKFNKNSYPFYMLILKKYNKNPYILISAGTHGWEPAGVYALLEFLNKKIEKYLNTFNFYIFPCINPSGFEYDILTNLNNVDLNREYKNNNPQKEVKIIKSILKKGPKNYLFTIDLHEVNPNETGEGFTKKDNPKQFYLYEDCVDNKIKAGRKIINSLKKDIPICKWEKIYGDINQGGVVSYPKGNKNKLYQKAVTFDQYLFNNYTKQAFIFETPAVWNIKKRIKTHIKALASLSDLKITS